MPEPATARPRLGWRGGVAAQGARLLPEETAIAFSYNRVAHAVMMATPASFEDFAVGFSLNERIIASPGDIEDLAIVAAPSGIELRMWIDGGRMEALTARRRQIAGPTGCGLCGLESLDDAMRPAPPVAAEPRFRAQALQEAMAALGDAQPLHAATRAVHAAALWLPTASGAGGLAAVREDVGRHNALDKLAGALARSGADGAAGAVLLTSRVSVELVQKTARIGAAVIVAVSAPTALAVRVADAARITVAAIARADGFEVFTHPSRIELS
ncbi:MAG: formate dehydrogenase accessory sulfurtransferase FdhD [Acetobacteraceae bacterium]|nr:formate dehydrogenase accessory sulfurtransferase FdhD [Acetobacteraceae bacterium]